MSFSSCSPSLAAVRRWTSTGLVYGQRETTTAFAALAAVFERVARRIHTNDRLPYRRRLDVTRGITDMVLPLA